MSDDPLMFDDDEDFGGDSSSKKPSLAEIWHNNPSLKLFAVVAIVGAGIIAFLVTGGEDKLDRSSVGVGSSVSDVPGTSELTPAYREAIENESKKRAQQAEKTGDSAFPTPVGKVKDKLEAPVDLNGNPLSAWDGGDDINKNFTRQRGNSYTSTEQIACSQGIQNLLRQFPPDIRDRYLEMIASMSLEDICKFYEYLKGLNSTDLRNVLEKLVSMTPAERRAFVETAQESQSCEQGVANIIDKFSPALQTRYRRMIRSMSEDEICKLLEKLKGLSLEEQRRLMSVLSNLTPSERSQLMKTVENLEGEEITKLVDKLNNLSRSEQGRLIAALNGMSGAEQVALIDMLSGLSDEDSKELINILGGLSETDQRTLVGALSGLDMAQRNQLLGALKNMSSAERPRLINTVARLGPVALSQLPGGNRVPLVNSAASAGIADITVLSPEKINEMSQQFSQQMGQILQGKQPQAIRVQNSGVARSFILPGIDRRQALSYIPVQSSQQKENTITGSGTSTDTTSNEAPALAYESKQNSSRVTRFSSSSFSNYGFDADDISGVLYNAGDIAYAQIINQANSDVPGPVLAYMASGPLAGARVLGSFSATDEYLIVEFNLAVKDKKEYEINAIALDPETTLPGVATDVDNHYFQKVFLPAAAAFVEGFSSAVVRQGTSVSVEGETVTTSQNELDTGDELLAGFEVAAEEFSDVLDDNADRPVTVRIDPGTRIGILFLEKVLNQSVE